MGLESVETRATEPEAQSRRERKKERTRREIYDAAMRLFARDGYEAVTVDAICEAADVARGTFFAHFPTKASLLFEYNRQTAAELSARFASSNSDAPTRLQTLAALLSERWDRHGDVMTSMLRALLTHPEEMARARSEERDLAHVIASVVRHGQARGELWRGIDPDLVAVVFLASSLSFLSGGLGDEPRLEPEEIRRQFLDLLLHGLERAGANA
jgi:AcrR family transcriptional regulator